MIRRYDLRRSDNYPYNGRISYVCSGSGTLNVVTGFPVKSAIVTFSTLPLILTEESMSSSSDTSSSWSTQSGNSFSSNSSLSSSSECISYSQSSETEIISGMPRLYVSGYTVDGFIVAYQNIPEEVGYIEFSYSAS